LENRTAPSLASDVRARIRRRTAGVVAAAVARVSAYLGDVRYPMASEWLRTYSISGPVFAVFDGTATAPSHARPSHATPNSGLLGRCRTNLSECPTPSEAKPPAAARTASRRPL
jgi:hypothetical protein